LRASLSPAKPRLGAGGRAIPTEIAAMRAPERRPGVVMAKSNKLSQQELIERRKRIPQRTQEILRKMISRRQAELCGPAEGGNRKGKRKSKPYLSELWPGLASGLESGVGPVLESEPEPELQIQMEMAMGKAGL
jgi:hypothetical protein